MVAQWSLLECCQKNLLALWRKAEDTVGITDTIEDIQVVISHSASIV